MVFSDILLLFSCLAFLTSFYYYSKERRILYEFIQQSRRHHQNKELERAMRQKAGRYLLLSVVFLLVSVPLLVQKIIELNN